MVTVTPYRMKKLKNHLYELRQEVKKIDAEKTAYYNRKGNNVIDNFSRNYDRQIDNLYAEIRQKWEIVELLGLYDNKNGKFKS